MATAVTSTIVLLQIIILKYTSPCKCSDSLLCKRTTLMTKFGLSINVSGDIFLWLSDLKYIGHAETNLALPLDWHTCF